MTLNSIQISFTLKSQRPSYGDTRKRMNASPLPTSIYINECKSSFKLVMISPFLKINVYFGIVIINVKLFLILFFQVTSHFISMFILCMSNLKKHGV